MEKEKIFNDLKPMIEAKGLILYSVDYRKENDMNVLEVLIDKKGFVDIEDLEPVTELVNEYLDKEDPIEEEYNLEVASRGLEKDFPFEDCEYYKGEWIEVKTFDQLHKGELVEYTSNTLTIKTDKNKKIKINANDIVSINIVVKF